ncbi:MAG: protein kinase, partial [Chloroflexi bacterium]|nr:protein kinase [Chloroflexota bacterium]
MPAFDFVLAGRYRLVGPLGEGGMAAVYRGRDLRLNREVAIKILRDDLTHDPEFLARFQREAQLVASLSHPNIVPVYDVGEESGTHFIVMEYVRGRTLKEAVELDGRLGAARAVAIMRLVLDALGHAHLKGLVHRDVKPQNILLTADGTPRLADFGIARLVDGSTTRTAAILGSAQYLSPEQSRGEEATPRSDIYSCGIVLYEMLAGHPPFDGPNALAIAHQHLNAPPPPLSSRLPGIDPSLERALMRSLAKDPAQRFEDAVQFADAIGSDTPSPQQTAIQPLSLERTAIQSLEAEGDGEDESPARPMRSPAGRPAEAILVRRSPRKTYLVTAFLAAAVAGLAYAAQLPLLSDRLHNYSAAPLALFPAVAIVMGLSLLSRRSWLYSLDANAAVVQWGLFGHRRLGVPLRQVVTLELTQSPLERVLG